MSFDSDTGLKEALETTQDYNVLMKNFPLNELISATGLNKITLAIVRIFSHLKKTKVTKYPLARTIQLIEAISEDLTNQMLKVLSTQRLMAVSFDDFEKTIKACLSVFTAWDKEYEKLQAMLRNFAKLDDGLMRNTNKKKMWRINPLHKQLQKRLVVMQNLRLHHDQFRLFFSQVYRPSVGNQTRVCG